MADSLPLKAKNAEHADLERLLTTPDAYTLSAKLEVQEQLRTSGELNQEETAKLETDIKDELAKIQQMKYLFRLGYRFTGDADGFIINCKTSTIVMDIIGIVIGVLFTSSFASAVMTTIAISTGAMPFEMGTMFGILVSFSLGTLGLLLFIRSLSRLVDHSSFELIKSYGDIRLTKRIDFAKEIIDVQVDEVKLRKEGKKIWIELGKVNAFEVEHSDVYDQKTLEALYERLVL